jgi:hypothetical protein
MALAHSLCGSRPAAPRTADGPNVPLARLRVELNLLREDGVVEQRLGNPDSP